MLVWGKKKMLKYHEYFRGQAWGNHTNMNMEKVPWVCISGYIGTADLLLLKMKTSILRVDHG